MVDFDLTATLNSYVSTLVDIPILVIGIIELHCICIIACIVVHARLYGLMMFIQRQKRMYSH